MLSLRSLDVYHCAVTLAQLSHHTADRCPPSSKELAEQLRRAGPSVLLNLSEGNGKLGRDRRRYYESARGSVSECVGIFELCAVLGIISVDERDEAMALLDRLMAMLTRMARR